MKTKFGSLVLASALMLSAFSIQANAQESTSSLKVSGKVSLSGKKAVEVKVLVYKDNAQITSITTKKNSFDLDLPFNDSYTLKIEKDGYETYSAFIDANVSGSQSSNRKVSMEIDLQVAGSNASAYYSDFPNAVLRYDQNTEEFISSEHYAAHIQEKKIPLQASTVD